MSELKNLSFDSSYEIDNSFDSDRFIKMRLRVMHSGKNPNYSHFSLESIESAKDTLSNTPILANVVEDADGNLDFGAHDMSIEENKMKDGEYKLIYKEIPIGLIPETNNYAIETIEDREYVTCDAYVWKEYSNYAQDIIESKSENKVSMEIIVDEYEMLADDTKYFDVKQYKYTGVTMLGDKYGTGMLDAKAEKFEFNADENKERFIQMAQELKFALSQPTEDPKTEEDSTEQVEEIVENFEQTSTDECVSVSTTEEPKANVVSREFELTARQILDQLNESLPYESVRQPDPNNEGEEEWVSSTSYWVMDYDSEYAYISVNYWDMTTDKHYYVRAKYTITETDAIVDKSSFEEIFSKWLTQAEIDALETEKNKQVMELQQERHDLMKEIESFKADIESKDTLISELKSFKDKVEMELKQQEIEEVISDFESVLKDNEEFLKIKENAVSMEVDELEKELFALEGKLKHVKSKKEKKPVTFSRVSVVENDTGVKTSSYGVADKYIPKK